MLAVVYDKQGKLELKEVDRPKLTEGNAIAKIDVASICGTDIRTYRYGSKKISFPRIIGHEMVGTIVEIGKDEQLFCRRTGADCSCNRGETCRQCKKGNTNLCDTLKLLVFMALLLSISYS